MSRKYGKTDKNQEGIVTDLRKVGASVHSLHRVGMGCPDLLVGYKGLNYLMEVKRGDLPPSQQKLRQTQVDFFREWRGQCHKVTSTDEALAVIGIINDA